MRYRLPSNETTVKIIEYVRRNYNDKTYNEAAAELGVTKNRIKSTVYAYDLPRLISEKTRQKEMNNANNKYDKD